MRDTRVVSLYLEARAFATSRLFETSTLKYAIILIDYKFFPIYIKYKELEDFTFPFQSFRKD